MKTIINDLLYLLLGPGKWERRAREQLALVNAQADLNDFYARKIATLKAQTDLNDFYARKLAKQEAKMLKEKVYIDYLEKQIGLSINKEIGNRIANNEIN